MGSQTKSILYARFNLFSLLISLLALMMAYSLEPLNRDPLLLFYLAIILKIALISFSVLYYRLILSKSENKKKSSKTTNFCYFALEVLFDNVPLCEFLIEINLVMHLNRNNYDYMLSVFLKPIYLGSKMMLNIFRKPTKALPKAFLRLKISALAIGLNYGLMSPLSQHALLSLLITQILLILVSFKFFEAMIGKSQVLKTKALKNYINERKDAVIIILQKSSKFEVIFASEEVWKLLPIKAPLNFETLSEALPHFEPIGSHREIFVKADKRMTSANSILPLGLTETIARFTSLNPPDEILTFHAQKKLEDLLDSKNDALGQDLEMTLKRMKIKNRTLFLLRFAHQEKKRKIMSKREIETRIIHSISHDLKTPLNSSLTLLELLRNQNSFYEETPNIYLENSLASLKILENMLNNVIDFSLFLTDQFINCWGQVNLHTLMNEIFSITNSRFQLKNLDFSIILDGMFGKTTIYTDYTRLKQILLNLLLNSLQFTNTGNISVEIHRTIPKKPLKVEFTITDTGIGMSPGFLSQLQSKLSNEDDSSQAQGNTTGSCLGLRISHKLAQLLGTGGLQIESTPGKGTTVKFTIVDQNMNEFASHSKLELESIRIEQKRKKLDIIKEDTLKIEFMRIRNKSLKKKETSLYSFEENKSEDISSSTNKISCETFVSQYMKNHYFDSIKRQNMFYESKEQGSTYYKNKTQKTEKGTYLSSYYTGVFKKAPKMPRKSEGNCNININIPYHHKEKDLLEIDDDALSQPIYITSKTVCTSDINKNSNQTQKENIECVCEEVLIVDDDAFNLICFEMILKTFSVRCVKAMNGKEAIEIVTKQSCASLKCHGFRLIFMDYQMPVMDGVESSKEILKLNSPEEDQGGRHIKIIGCTAFTTKSEVQNFLEAGLKDVIFKPLNKEIVGNILKEWL